MHFLTSRKSKLSIENKLKIYKTIIKPIWTYGIPLWGTASMSHINKIEIIQAKILRTIVNAPGMSETRTYGGTWKSQRSRKQSAAMQKDTRQE